MTIRAITETDWKVFQKLHPILVDRYCELILLEINRFATEGDNSHHERYLAIYAAIQQHNDEMARLFDNPRRSSALMQLMAIHALGLLSAEERLLFSDDTVNLLVTFNSRLVDDESKEEFTYPTEDKQVNNLLALSGACEGGPADLADRHDRYLRGEMKA